MTLRDARVLVIGGLGFIGVNLVSRLIERGAKTTILTPRRGPHEAQAAAFQRAGVAVMEGDLRDRDRIAALVSGQHIVINLSGQSGAVRSMDDPWTDLDVICRGSLVLLEALRDHNRDAKVVFAGSRLQYGHPERLPVSEDAPKDALCLHAIHKQTVEQYLALYHRLFGIRYTVARITNPYGPGQPAGRTAYGVINRMIHLAIAGRTLAIYGDGAQVRDYIHVDDVVQALLTMAASDRPPSPDGYGGTSPPSPDGYGGTSPPSPKGSGETSPPSPKGSGETGADGHAYNVGSGTGTRLIDLATRVIAIAGRGRIEHVPWPTLAEQVETGDFVADISRIERELGWRPTIALHDGLERTVAFYRAESLSS